MSYSLNSLKGYSIGEYNEGHTRSLDYGSYATWSKVLLREVYVMGTRIEARTPRGTS